MPHGFTVGQGIQIKDAQENQLPAESDTYNGYFAIESVPTPTSFTYRMISIPSFNADAKPGAKVNVLHQVQECIVENNVFELLPTINDFGQHVAIGLYAFPNPEFRAFPVFRRVVIRGNIVRLMEDRFETTVKALAVDVHFCEHALVENNVVDLPTPNPLRNQNNVASTSVNYFNNRDSGGKLIQGASVAEIAGTPVTTMVAEVTTTVEDAFMLGFL